MNMVLTNGTNLELIKLLLDNTPIAYVVLDRNYEIHYINESFIKLRKLNKDTILGDRCYNVSNGGVPCSECAVKKALFTGEKAFVSRKDTFQDGTVRFVDDYAIPLQKNELGEVEFVLEIMINRTDEMLGREKQNEDYLQMLCILTSLIEEKDNYTAMHSENVRRFSVSLAKALNLSSETVFEISVAATLHDIGKIDISNEILNKPGSLTKEEFEKIKEHPVLSSQMLDKFLSFKRIQSMVRNHHERIDGKGYPDGLTGEELSVGAKIIAIADTYDAITTTRSYRKAFSHEYAIEELQRVAGSQLDSVFVSVFCNMNFKQLDTKLYSIHKEEQQKQIKREIKPVDTNVVVVKQEKTNFSFDMEELLEKVFQNTPCGYVLLDRSLSVQYASDYFVNYLSIQDKDVINKKCYILSKSGQEPCKECPVINAFHSKKNEFVRWEQQTSNGTKIFDFYAIPLLPTEGTFDYVIEIIIDRTQETHVESTRQKDFESITQLLKDIYSDRQNEIDKRVLSEQIKVLENLF